MGRCTAFQIDDCPTGMCLVNELVVVLEVKTSFQLTLVFPEGFRVERCKFPWSHHLAGSLSFLSELVCF